MKPTSTSLAVAALLAATVVAIPGSAGAASRNVSGGAACKAANGGASASFSYSNNFLTNNGTTPQYVVCNFTMDDETADPAPTERLVLHAHNTQAATRTLTCSAQTGSYTWGANQVVSNSVKIRTFAASENGYLTWTPSLVVRSGPSDVLTINCLLDPGIRIGLIEYRG